VTPLPTAAELVRRADRLATLPASYHRVLDVADDPRSTTAELAQALEQDATLTAALLRLVNSAAFGSTGIETVPHAIALVGVTEVLDLALTTSLVQRFAGIDPQWVDMRAFWLHSVGCGVSARALAVRGGRSAGRLFTAGMLHDIGRLLLYLEEPEVMARAGAWANEHGESLAAGERRLLGTDHAEVGAALLATWGLPETLRDLVEHHHRPEASARPPEASTVHLADVLAHSLELGTSGERRVPAVAPNAWEVVGLTVDDLPLLLAEIERQYRDVAQILMAYDGLGT
jgi:putative nucleotidyltransferase with HDIG domain